jgi:hypothetical protein
MSSAIVVPVLSKPLQLKFTFSFVRNQTLDVFLDERLDLVALQYIPDGPREIKEESLHEQDDADPLVVAELLDVTSV